MRERLARKKQRRNVIQAGGVLTVDEYRIIISQRADKEAARGLSGRRNGVKRRSKFRRHTSRGQRSALQPIRRLENSEKTLIRV